MLGYVKLRSMASSVVPGLRNGSVALGGSLSGGFRVFRYSSVL